MTALRQPLAGHTVTNLTALYEPLQSPLRVGVSLYNLFNANTGTAFNQNFGTNGATWLRPNAILNPRYARFNATVDF